MKAIVLFLISFYCWNSFAANVHGVLMVVKGDVFVVSSKDKKSIKAKVGAKVFPGDSIETKKDSRAKLVMIDKNIINISPDSKFLLEKYEYNQEQDKKGALLNVIYGKVRATVTQKYDGEQNRFQVKTKSSVAGVRGTDFMVSYSAATETSKVVTFEGRVEVGAAMDASGRIQNSVFVSPGQFTVAERNTPPVAPTAVPPHELNSLNQQTSTDTAVTNQSGSEPGTPMQKNESEKNENESQPAGSNPQSRGREPGSAGPAQGGGGLLDEMGEDVGAPVAVAPIAPPQMLPPQGTLPNGVCPNGQCVPLNVIDPNLMNGKTKVLIQITPNP